MRRLFTGVIIAASMFAAHGLADVDLGDFDNDLMRGMEDSIKSFEPNIAARNSQRALADAQILWDGFKWTEDYFTKKGGAEDAVEIARQALEHTGSVMQFLEANDFENAANAARSAARTCRTCHDIYKSS
jgi:hypothetical protein